MLKPIKRTAIDSKVWWVPWNSQEHSYGELIIKYCSKKERKLAMKVNGLKMDRYWRWTKN